MTQAFGSDDDAGAARSDFGGADFFAVVFFAAVDFFDVGAVRFRFRRAFFLA